ncbi:MAG: hypothetical protein LH465_02360 [Sphingomonas bacterium]|nr:hypothetical protein [Sphingomonas bacterium]
MIAAMIAIQLTQVQPVMRPAPRMDQPRITAIAPLTVRKQQMLAEARVLLARAEADRDKAGAPGGPTKSELDAMLDDAKTQMDSMSEMGEMESLRLQMAMDRLSKMMSTLSNLLKKTSETSSSITQNLK